MPEKRPLHRDPLATYDSLGRKEPRRAGGLIELMRGMPWLMGAFDKEVPSEFFQVDGDSAVVACPCKTEDPPVVPFNVATRCDGDGCGRWFFFDSNRVRVAREPAETDLQTSVVD